MFPFKIPETLKCKRRGKGKENSQAEKSGISTSSLCCIHEGKIGEGC